MNLVHNKHSPSSDLEFLKDFPIFNQSNPSNTVNNTRNPVNHDKFIKLATQFKSIQLKSHQLLYSQSDFSNYIYFLVSGTVQLNYRFEQNPSHNLNGKPIVNYRDQRLLRSNIQLHRITLTKLTNKSITQSSNGIDSSSHDNRFQPRTARLSLRNAARIQAIGLNYNNQHNNANTTYKENKLVKKDKHIPDNSFQTVQSRVQNLVNSAKKQAQENKKMQNTDNSIMNTNNMVATTITPEQIHFERLKELEAEFYYYADPHNHLEKSKFKTKTITSVINTHNTGNSIRTPTAPLKPKPTVTSPLINHNQYIELTPAEYHYGIAPHPQTSKGTTVYFRLDIAPSNLNCPMLIYLYSTDSSVCIYANHTTQIPMSSDNSSISSSHVGLVPQNSSFGGKKIYTQLLTLERTESTCYYLSTKFNVETGYCIYIDCLNPHNTRYDCALIQSTSPAVLGLLELNENEPRYCAVQAVTPCELYCIERDTFISVMKNTTILNELIRLGSTQLQQYKPLAQQKLNLAMKMGPHTSRIQLTQPTFATLPKSIFNISRPQTAQLPITTEPESLKLDKRVSTPRILSSSPAPLSVTVPTHSNESYNTEESEALSPLHQHPRRSSLTYAEFVHTDNNVDNNNNNNNDNNSNIGKNFEPISPRQIPASIARQLPEKINEFAHTLNSIHELDSSMINSTALPEFMIEKMETPLTPAETIKEIDMKWATGEGLQFHRVKMKDIELAKIHSFTPRPPSSGPYSARRHHNPSRLSHAEEKDNSSNPPSRPHTGNNSIPILNFSRITLPMNPMSRPHTARLGLNVTADTERAERFNHIHLEEEFRPHTAVTITKSDYNRAIRVKQQQLLAEVEKAKFHQEQLIRQQSVKIHSKPIFHAKKKHRKKTHTTIITTTRTKSSQDVPSETITETIQPQDNNETRLYFKDNRNVINSTESLSKQYNQNVIPLDVPLTTDDLLTSPEKFQSELDELLQDSTISNLQDDLSDESSGDISIDTDDELFELEEQRKEAQVAEKMLEMQF